MEVGRIYPKAVSTIMKGYIADSSGRRHVNADLRPYICLEPDCLTSEQQYAKRHEWLNHMNHKHWRVFKCPYSCHEADFDSHSQLERHLRRSHPELSSQRDLSMMFDLCERPRPWPEESECPLCQQALYSEREYARHVGRHQTELALFALPNRENDEVEEDGDRSPYDYQHWHVEKYPRSESLEWSASERSELDYTANTQPPQPDLPQQSIHPNSQPTAQMSDTKEREHSTTAQLSRRSSIASHSDSSKPSIGPFVCEECGRTFDEIHKFNHHKRYHDRTHACPYEGCDRKFGTKTHLDRHVNDRHLKLRQYHCAEAGCEWAVGGKSFPRKDNWRRHLVKKHGYTVASLPEELGSAEPDALDITGEDPKLSAMGP